VRRDVKIRLAVKTVGQFPAVKTVVQFARRLRALDERVDELQIAFAFFEMT
jgi:hypothetical protein